MKLSDVALLLPIPFNLSNLCQTSPVSFFTAELRRHKRAHDLQRQLFTNNSSSQA